jgi:hypothetical protein
MTCNALKEIETMPEKFNCKTILPRADMKGVFI